MKTLARIIINSAVGIALIFIWLRFVNLEDILRVLTNVRLEFLSLIFLFILTSGILRALRLKLLLVSEVKLPLKSLIFLTFLGQLLSFLIPLRIGEISKSVYLSTQYSIPLGKSVVWIFIDRFLDFWTDLLLITLLLLVVEIALPNNLEQIIILILIAFSLIPFIAIKSAKLAKKLLNLFSKLLIFNTLKGKFLTTTGSIVDGFEILHPRLNDLSLFLLISGVASVSDSLIWFITLRALGVEIGFLDNLLGSLLNVLTFLAPSAPGYIGSAEAAGLAIFGGILGIESNIASAATILNHGVTTIALLVFGLISIYLLKFDLKLVWKKIKKS